MKNILLIFVFLIGVSAQAQDNKHGTIKVRKNIPIKDYVDIDFIPEYDFGILYQVIKGSMKYPKDALAANIEGTVSVLVIIDQTGHIVWQQVQGNDYPLLQKEANRIISNLATFKPVIKDNAAVAVRTTIPVEFVIE